jgi:hypothetical protein
VFAHHRWVGVAIGSCVWHSLAVLAAFRLHAVLIVSSSDPVAGLQVSRHECCNLS